MAIGLFKETALVLADEKALWKERKTRLAAFAIALVPLLNCIIFTGSVWDPYGRLDRLQAALVNRDRGATLLGTEYRLGDALAEKLVKDGPLGFTVYPYEEWARADLDSGKVRAVFVLPEDFSESALAGSEGRTGKIRLLVSEGQSAFTSKMAEGAATAMSAAMNALIQEKRWAALGDLGPRLGSALGSVKGAVARAEKGAGSLAEGADMAAAGARRLEEGLGRAQAGAGALAAGAERLSGGAARLAEGARAAKQGSRELASGAKDLAAGASGLSAGASTLNAGVAGNKLAPADLKAGAKRLAEGSAQVAQGSGRLEAASGQLARGLLTLAEGAGTLDSGAQELAANAAQLPAGLGSLKEGAGALASGGESLGAGAHALKAGLEELYAKIPDEIAIPLGDAASMARSIVVEEEKTNPIPNNGNGFAPYFMAMNLWLGALFTTFFLPYRSLKRRNSGARQAAKVAGKLAAPLALVCVQAVAMVGGMALFGVRFSHPWAAFGTAILSSGVYLCLVSGLILLLADSGRLLAVILTIVQAASAGGTFPTEFASRFYQVCSAIVPMRFCLDGLRYSISGAYAPQFGQNMLKLAAVLLFAIHLLALGRKKWVMVEEGPIPSMISM